MKLQPIHLNGIYKDLAENLGIEITKMIYNHYKGLQITFPLKFYSKDYLIMKIHHEHINGKNFMELSREYGYSERWIRNLIASKQNLKRS